MEFAKKKKGRVFNEQIMHKQIKRTVSIFFLGYCMLMLFYGVSNHVDFWMLSLIVMALVAEIAICQSSVGSYMLQCFMITSLMCTVFLLQVYWVHDIFHLFPYLCTMMVMVAWMSVERLILLPLFSGLFGLVGYVRFWYPTNNINMERMFSINAQAVNMISLSLILIIWTRHRNQTQRMMRKNIQNLVEAEDSRDDFLANVSHEIRTPINTICGISEILLQKEMDPEIRSQLFYIQVAGRNLTSVVSDILDFSELLSGKVEIANEEYNITSTINDIVDMSMAKIGNEKVEIVVDCDADIPSVLLGDEKKIRRAIMNLMDNAVKFTEAGCIFLKVGFRRESYGINLVIEVQDTGIGMSQSDVEKLFTNYAQVDTRRNRKNGGVGLGLAISQIMIEKMGGIINIKSQMGVGTSARIVVPQKVVRDEPIVKFEEIDKIKMGLYINFEKYVGTKLRDAYTQSISHMIEQVQVKCHICSNLPELKRRFEYEKFTHIIISQMEYLEDQKYFDNLSKHIMVIVSIYREHENEITNPRILKLYKPYYIFPVVALLKGSLRGNYAVEIHRKFSTVDVKALVVDDNMMNLRVMQGILRKYNISCVTANSGRASLAVIEQKDFDIVFMDHMMPEMDGVEALHNIRAMSGNYYQTVPIVALTANTVAGAREMFLGEGFSDFIEKPVENSVLERLLLRNLPEYKIVYKTDDEEEIKNAPAEASKEEAKTEALMKTARDNKVEVDMNSGPEQPAEKATATSTEETVVEKKLAKKDVEEKKFVELSELRKRSTQQLEEKVEIPEAVKEESCDSDVQDGTIGDLDKEAGMMFCGGEENWISILQVCGDTAEENRTQLKKLFQEQNWKEYTILVHGIKSSMKTIGATPLSEMAKALEMAGKSDDINFILENHQAMVDEFNRVDAMIHASPLVYEQTEVAEVVEATTLEEITEEAFANRMVQIEEAMYDFDGEAMKRQIEELQQYQFMGVSLEKPLRTILRKVEMSDYMSAYDTLAKVKEDLTRRQESNSEEV